ncbi:sugar transporter domain-containing protein [Phthorimaea operculella]|nr:sugar transporter domain-containing protein [Phthorimaea operculella]
MEHGHTYRQWMISILANTTVITYGLQAGWISPMTKTLQSANSPTGSPLSDTELSWIASVMCLTAVVGVFLFTYIADSFGRRTAVILVAVPHALCWIFKLSSANTTILIIARIFSGLSAGACFNIIPIYVKEISQDNIRGLTGSIMMLFMNVGYITMYIMGAYLDYFTVLKIVIFLPFATALLMWKAPETPSFLVKLGKFEEAASTIAWLRGLNEDNKQVEYEVYCLQNQKTAVEAIPSVTYSGLFKERSWRFPILLMFAIMTIVSANGCFAILTYASTILATSGVTVSPELQAMSFPAVSIIGGFISMASVERFGRKILVALTSVLISASMFGLGGVIYMQNQDFHVPGWLPALFMMVAVGAFAAGVGPVPYIIMSEMFNFQIRAKVLGLIISYAWFINFIQIFGYAPIAAMIGAHNAFFGFGILNFIAFVIVVGLLPETKGKSPEEIEAKYRRN